MGKQKDVEKVVPSLEGNNEADRTNQVWTIVGTVSTVWSVVIAIILALIGNLRSWIGENASWVIPIILLSFFGFTLTLGYLLRGLRRGDRLAPTSVLLNDRETNQRVQFANVNTILERESQARVIWVVSPRLFYDVYNPDFRRVIAANKARNASYRYIVPNSREVRRNINTYRQMYKETEEQEREAFLTLPESKFTAFLTEIAIYDPGEPTMYAFSGPPSPNNIREDVMVFDRELSQDYAKRFSDIWMAQKKKLP